jgi:hypothetical protein
MGVAVSKLELFDKNVSSSPFKSDRFNFPFELEGMEEQHKIRRGTM